MEEDSWDSLRVQQAEERILKQGPPLNPYWRQKYESQANKYWHDFYKRNTTNFYKDRHYLHVEFPELLGHSAMTPSCAGPVGACQLEGKTRLLEVGCGVGNAVIPLIELNDSLEVHAVDFADSAIQLLGEHPCCAAGRLHASVCCVVSQELPVPPNSMDLVLCMFVLSAIAPQVGG